MVKNKKLKKEYDEKIRKIGDRLEHERISRKIASVAARMIPSPVDNTKLNVKIFVKINDTSFYCREIKIHFSIGNVDFQIAKLEKLENDLFGIKLINIPLDVTVLYFFDMLDKGGVWLKLLKSEDDNEPFEFSTFNIGISEFTDEWSVNLIKCDVCDYMCKSEWDICPGCKSPMHDIQQEIFQQDQIAREESYKPKSEYDNELWKNLPECQSCGNAVRIEWESCPICGSELKNLQIKSKEINESEEREIL